MKNLKEEKKMRKIIFIFVVINLYFIICLFKGQNTIINYFKYKNEISKKKTERDMIINSKHQLDNIIQLLSDKNVDLDVLDELSRRLAQLSLSDEKMILIDEENKS